MRCRHAARLSFADHRFVLCAWVAALTILAAPATALADGRYYNSDETIQTSHPDWMKWVPDTVRLSELSIPGTHQSVGRQHGFTTDFVLTQGLPVADQLNAGIRALHVELEIEADGSLTLKDDWGFDWNPTFGQVLATVDAFLTSRPTETVLIWVEGGDQVRNAAKQYLVDSYPGRAFSFELNPTMATMRGKVLLLNDQAPVRSFVQDDPYVDQVWGVEDKWDRVRSHLDGTATGSVDRVYVNFLSGEDSGSLATLICVELILQSLAYVKDPYSLAAVAAIAAVTCGVAASTYAYPYAVAGGSELVTGVNDYALEYLLESRTVRRTGILMMDFPGAALIDAIIAHNFRFVLNVPMLATDFYYMFNNIAYNGTEIGGDQQALDRLNLLHGFANFVFQDASGNYVSSLGVIDVVVWGNDAQLGGAFAGGEGLYRQTDFINTDNIFETRRYTAVGFNVNGFLVLPSAVRTALPALVGGMCPSLSGGLNDQATTLRNALVARFPDVRWNAVVKDGVGGFDNWAYAVGNAYDTGGSGHRCVVWGYPAAPPPPPPPENHPPTVRDFVRAPFVGALAYALSIHDADGEPVTIEAVDLPGTTDPVTGDRVDWLTWYQEDYTAWVYHDIFDASRTRAPNPSPGNYTTRWRLSDGTSTVLAELIVKVNALPAFISPAHLPNIGGANSWEVVATDVNDDPITMSAPLLPNGLLFEDTGSGRAKISVSPTAPPAPGEYQVHIEASDGITNPATATGEVAGPAGQTFTLTVLPVATDTDPPAIVTSAKTSDGALYAAGAWTNQTVTVQFACFDAGVGVATCPADVILDAEGVTPSVSGTATDGVGNSATTSFGPVQIDRTAPAIIVSATSGGVPYVPGTWATQPVTVTFACTDALSGVNTVTPPTAVTAAGANQSLVGVCSDYAGNITNASVTDINIDSDTDGDGAFDHFDNAPNHFNPDQRDTDQDSIADVVDACPNDATNACDASGSAAVYLDAAEGGTLAAPDGSVSLVIPPDAAAASASVSITDLANDAGGFALTTSNQGHVLGVLAVDLQPSQTFSEPVIITFTWPDADNDGIVDGTNIIESRLIVTKDDEVVTDLCRNEPVDETLLGCDQETNTFRFAVTSWSTFLLGVHDDDTGPEVVASAKNADGSEYVAGTWTNQAVTVHFDCADPGGSGVASCPADQVVDAEGVTASIIGTATDRADNSTSASFGAVNIDKTAPTISATATTGPNGAGWYNGDVTIHFSCADAGSGIPAGACPADQVLSAEGLAVASSVQMVTDAAGNTSEASNIVTVQIDRTGPTVAPLVSPNPVVLNGSATAAAGAEDTLSGLDSSICEALVTTSVGPKSVTCSATDRAGNTTDMTAAYKVIYRFDGFLQPINDPAYPQACGLPCLMSTFKGGSTVPVKFQLRDASGAVVQSSGAVAWLTPANVGPLSSANDEASYDEPATGGSFYFWDGEQYHYNWSTRGLVAGYVWRIGVQLDDGETYFVQVGLR